MSAVVDQSVLRTWAPEVPRLNPRARRWLRERLDLPAPTPAPAPSAVPDRPLPGPVADALAGVVGAAHVITTPEARLGHAGGMSYLDLIGPREPPDAVVLPASTDEVVRMLRACARHDVAVVPYGGGTSVVGGVDTRRGRHAAVIACDLALLDHAEVDPVSLTATLGAGLTGPDAERLLAARGLTCGHVPQSFERASIGGFAATGSAGQTSNGYGRFADLVLGARLATPVGELAPRPVPGSAAGPDLRRLVLGSEGAFGIITEVTVRVRPMPAHRRYEAWAMPSFAAGADAIRSLAQADALPDVARLSDATETSASLALSGSSLGRWYARLRGLAEPCLLVLGWEGRSVLTAARRYLAVRAMWRARAVYLGTAAGRAWERHRFSGPRQRDALLAAGALVETLETAGTWSALPGLYRSARAALAEALPGAVVGVHLSHAYPTGASVYVTVLGRRDPADPVRQWREAKRAATEAILAAGGTLTHHHAVGLTHRPWLADEVGQLGVDVLRAVKDSLDPHGICNPGKLVPPVGSTADTLEG